MDYYNMMNEEGETVTVHAGWIDAFIDLGFDFLLSE